MLIAFVIMGFLASCAGIISSARTFSAQFNVGEGAEMDAISAVVLGGTTFWCRRLNLLSGFTYWRPDECGKHKIAAKVDEKAFFKHLFEVFEEGEI